ncbi:T7SS effector LXG polymorphic toxin [uncultured Ligilactobacillus sp.]|uniref:T7SS effector LXG polymorphic toxin n=2 Tax=uncultured Ligilactobacillus sp. TaxID=2837633 RepID=UPI00272C91E8|nr:T7SS effector LXG polymorphic toxin [uncultured Ligilactobacillus sp.]
MRIDVGEVLATKNELSRTKMRLLGSLSDAKMAADSVKTSNALAGQVKKAVEAEYANYKIPFITVLEEALIGLVNTFDQKIDDFKEIVKETADNAVIDTQTIDELKQTLCRRQNELKELDASFKRTYSSVSDIVSVHVPSINGTANALSDTRKVYENTKQRLTRFENQNETFKKIDEQLELQQKAVGSIGTEISKGYGTLNTGSYLFNTDYLISSQKFDKDMRATVIKRNPALEMLSGTDLDTRTLNDISKMIGDLKWGKGKYKVAKDTQKYLVSAYLVAALKQDSKGRIGFKTAEELYKEIEKHLPKAAREKLEKPLKKLIEHLDNKYIVKAFQTSKSGLSKKNMRVLIDIKANVVKGGEKLAKQLYIYDTKKIVSPQQKGSLKVKDYLKEAKSSALKELHFKAMFKDFSKAKGLGRVIPGINIASKTLSLYDGFNESNKMANEHKLKGKARAMSLIGGTAIDLGDMAVTAGLSTVGSMVGTSITTELLGGATAMFGLAITPTLLTVGVGVVIGIGAAIAVSKFIDGSGYKKKIKRAWNDFWENI